MNDAELYSTSNAMQRREGLIYLGKYADKMNWKRGGRVLDVGCGDGSLTSLLQNFSPFRFSEVIGCDVSGSMVEFANRHYGSRTTFTRLDIVEPLPGHFRNNFDNVFSFIALHWVHNQELAFRNIYGMLVSGGDCLVTFIAWSQYFDVCRLLSKDPKWAPWMTNVEDYVALYQDIADPRQNVAKMLKEIGFSTIDVKYECRKYVFEDTKLLKNMIAAVNALDIPKEIFDDYLDDFVKIFKVLSKKFNNKDGGDSDELTKHYNLIVFYATK